MRSGGFFPKTILKPRTSTTILSSSVLGNWSDRNGLGWIVVRLIWESDSRDTD